MADFFSLPQGADPENDPLTGGQDEFGNPLRQTFLGTVYSLQQQPAEKKFESEPGTMARAKEVGSGIVEGAIEGVKQAVTAPRRAMQGEDISYGDVLGTAGMATTGASVATKPKGSLSTGAARTKKKSEINPLFKKREAKDSSLVTFYSPLRSAIEEMQFSEKGKSGQEIMAYLNKRAPNVSKGEIDFSRIDLDPKKKYSKDEVLDNLQYSTEGVKAKLIERDFANYEKSQIPKNYLDAYDDYFEITLEPQALPKQLRTHHTNKTLGHSRATVHTSRKGDGERYIVLNEIQSDALQNAGKKDTSNLTTPRELANQFAESVEDDTGFAMSGEARNVLDFISEYYEDPKLPYEKVKKAYKDDFGLDVQGRDVPTLHKDALRKSLGSDAEKVRALDLVMEEMPIISQRLIEAKTSYEKADIPIKSNTEYVKNILIANIAKAKKMGIDTLVVPSIDEIARLRAGDFDGGISAAKKALKPTYVDAVKKAVRVLNNEYGDRIKLGTKDIDYEDLTKPDKTRTTKGLALDISNFDFDPRNEAVRFAEGGLVEDNPIFQHHQKNVDEGTYVKNKDGSISTVYTTIMGDGEYEYLIPQVWDGKILSEDEAFERAMSSGIKWPKAPAGEEGVRELEDLDKKLHEKMQGFAEGGEVKSMEEQMNLFEYGGLADDGMDIEPVTGNEVPPGSLAKEVRDDVPAMLSEGEYVVPADVVRYFGVKFFEDLRNKAKSDMVDLEAEGRIGGEPVDSNGIPMEEDEDLTPEEMAMLEEALGADSGMAMGGLAINQQPPQDPYQQQQTMYAQQYANGGMVRGYQTGGSITQPTFRYMPGQKYPMGSAYGAGSYSATGGFEARTYVNETTGQTRTFQFLNGQPISFIPPGFVPYSQAETTAASAATPTTTTTTPRVREEGDGKDAPDMSYDVTEMTEDELGRMANPNSPENMAAKGIFGLAGPIGAILGQIGARARAKEAQEELSRRAEINDKIKSDVEDVLEGLKNDTQTPPTGTPAPTGSTSTAPTTSSRPQARPPELSPAPPVPNITVSTLSPAPPGLPSIPVGGIMPDAPAPTGLPSGSQTTPPTVGTPVFSQPQAVPSLPSEPTFTGFPTQDLGIPGLGNPTAPTAQEVAFADVFSNISMGETFSDDGRTPDYAGTPGYGLKGGPTMSGVPGPTSAIGQQVGGRSPTFGLSGTGGSKASEVGLNYSGITGTASSPDRAGFEMGDVSPPGTPSSTAANAPGATADIGGRDVSIGYGAGQVDPGLAAAAAAAERGGGGEGPSGPSGGGQGSTSGGGGSDSGQAGGGGAGGYGGGSSGGDAGTGSDNDGDGFGDMGGIAGGWSKGGMVTKKKKGLGGRP